MTMKRQKRYVDRKVQAALVRQTVFHWTLVLVTTLFMVFLLQVLTGGPFKSWSYHVAHVWDRYAPFIIALVVVIPPIIYDSLRLSHRFVGPIYRLRSALNDVVKGGPPQQIKFRKDDFWQDLAADYNVVMKRLESQSSQRETKDETEEPEMTPELIAG